MERIKKRTTTLKRNKRKVKQKLKFLQREKEKNERIFLRNKHTNNRNNTTKIKRN